MKTLLLIAALLPAIIGCEQRREVVTGDPIWYTPDCLCEYGGKEPTLKSEVIYAADQLFCGACGKQWRPLGEWEIGALEFLTLDEIAAHLKGIGVPMATTGNRFTGGQSHINGIDQEKQCLCVEGLSSSYEWAAPLVCEECGTAWRELE